ncbi:uncharacterized protein LOC141855030 isoform X1 [Brevipalpus obovatus]|uniref:uncharacterized protein LOC141855030 isoform X1 n=1 Tax=Brevipalpus obovatus TaxID=246614 RepID=UPI003D9E93E3
MSSSEKFRSNQQVQSFYTAKAHVFHIDPQTKRSWIPTSCQACSVCFVHDPSLNAYRIISVEGSKAIINSTITANMTFTKTSQKFGQWSDIRANTVYGLGFATESELNSFIEKFQEVKELTRTMNVSHMSHQNGSVSSSNPQSALHSTTSKSTLPRNSGAESIQNDLPDTHYEANSGSASLSLHLNDVNSNRKPTLEAHQRSQSLSGLQVNKMLADSPKHNKDKLSGSSVLLSQSNNEAQLRYENDRLKLALAQSSANAKKWEIELQTLRNNNARLTSALQESTANVEEWKKQLQSLKDENGKMRMRIVELEASHGNPEAIEELSKEINNLRTSAASLDVQKKQKDKEIDLLKKSLEQHVQVCGASQQVEDKLKMLLSENESLRNQISRLQDHDDGSRISDKTNRGMLDQVNYRLGQNIQELKSLHREFTALLNAS